MRQSIGVAMLISLLAAGGVHGQEAGPGKAKPKTTLASAYTPVLGEFVALAASNLLGAMKPVDAPILVSFDRDEKVLEAAIFGARSSVDGAKEVLEEFRQSGVPLIQFVASEQYGITIAENEITLIYLNRTAGYAVVLSREKGQYIIGGSE